MPPLLQHKALVVSIADYGPSYPEMRRPGCATDGEEWSGLVQDIYGCDVTRLRDGEATRPRVLRELELLLSGATAGERRVFMYAGHGTSGRYNKVSKQALVLYPEPDTVMGANHLLDDHLVGVINGVTIDPAALLTFVFDACYAGGFDFPPKPRRRGAGQEGARTRFWAYERPEGLESAEALGTFARLGAGRPRPLLVASAGREKQAHEREMADHVTHGEFSYHATRLLRAAGGVPSHQSLRDDADRRMRQEGYDQDPQLRGQLSRAQRPFFD